MIPEISKTAARWIIIALAVFTVASLVFAVKSCQSARTAKTAEKLATGQADAAVKSGADAVQTVGNTAANEAAGDRITQENEDAIDKAKGADAGVDPDARAVGLRSLCRRASYRASHPECVQHPPAR